MIFAVALAMLVFQLWIFVAKNFLPFEEQTVSTQPADSETDKISASPTTLPATSPATLPTTVESSEAIVSVAKLDIPEGDSTEPVELGKADDNSPFPMAIEIMPRGASVSKVYIRGHHDSVTTKEPYPMIMPVIVHEGTTSEQNYYSFATQQVSFEDYNLIVPLDRCIWKKGEQTDERSVWYLDIPYRGKMLARITKTYELKEQSRAEKTSDLGISIKIENLSGKPLNAVLTQYGPTGFRKEDPRGRSYHNVIIAQWEDGVFNKHRYDRAKVIKQSNPIIGSDTEKDRVGWVAQSNKYFTCIMAPKERVSPDDPMRFGEIKALHLTDIEEDDDYERKDLTYSLTTTKQNIPQGGVYELAFDCYLGPKSKAAFQNIQKYSQRNYYTVISDNFLWCAPNALVGLMMWLLDAFHEIPPHNYGLAIIILVLVVKGILHPITKKSQINMMKMQKNTARVQPKLQALKEKYGNDRAKYNQEMMRIYREEGLNPAGNILTCLPMFLQFPIWVSLWTALASTVEMRHAHFLWWINDLSAPDAAYHFAEPITVPILSMLMGGAFHSLNLLPVLLAVSQLLQARFMPRGNVSASNDKNPDQLEQQRKMMMFMSVFFMFILYNAPSGLCLYILSSNLFGIVEQWQIRKHLEHEEKKYEEKMETVRAKAKSQPKKKTWLQKVWQDLEKHAEEARRLQTSKPEKKN